MTLSAPEITAEDARHLTDRIKIAVEGTWQLITEAYTSRAYIALGYRNWDDYWTREFGTSRLRLPREERSEVVASLRESGLSVRAIAVATGQGVGTVHRELSSGVPNGTPEDDPEPNLTQEECEALAQCEDVVADYLSQYDDYDLCDDCGFGDCECPADHCNCALPPTLPESDRVVGTDGKSYPANSKGSGVKKKNRRSHLEILENVAASLAGTRIVLDDITELDGSVNGEEADRLADDLSKAIRSLNRIRTLIKESTQ